MTASNFKKMLRQLTNKPVKYKKFLKHNTPNSRKFGIGSRKCRRCGRYGAHIQKYDMHLCRQCFRDIAKEIGFKKYS